MLNVCLICSALLIVKVIFVITAFFSRSFMCYTILVNKDDQSNVVGKRTDESESENVVALMLQVTNYCVSIFPSFHRCH